jgi:predicted nuclease of restriction endonuclease-like (RecB) superfamily
MPAMTDDLLGDVRTMIDASRASVAHVVNTRIVHLYWCIGTRIYQDVLKEERAEYGEEIIDNLARELTHLYGSGFGRRNLFRMVRFAEVFPHLEIVSTLWTQLSWSHFREIIPLKDDLQRAFYAEICRIERWSVRTLQDKIRLMLYERTAVAKKPEDLISQELDTLRETDQMTPDLVFRDPYVLDFLGLLPQHSETELETAILGELERFLLELGAGFCFVARQKRMSIGLGDYYLDLLFFHRGLRRLVAIELKIGRFTAGDKGQMELYLRWLEKYETHAGEEPPIGLVLCAEKDEEQIELLRLDEGEIRVAEYMTALPPRALLEEKFRQAILRAREQCAETKRQNESELLDRSYDR